jgi:hypothetical protein
MIEQLAITTILVIAARSSWVIMQNSGDMDHELDYLVREPNAFRLWDRTLLIFHRRPFSIYTLQSISFALCLVATYLFLTPRGDDLIIFLLSAIAMSSYTRVRASIGYPLLAMLVLTESPLFLLPLILIKEHTGFVGLGYLLLHSGIDMISIAFCGGVALMLYISARVFLPAKPRAEHATPLFTPRRAYAIIRGRGRSRFALFWAFAYLPLVIWFGLLRSPLLLLWATIPILLFALFWEPQLWFPVVIVLLGVSL